MAQSLSVEDVKSLTNEELRNILLSYGVDAGPVMVTTRRVYERKLERLIQNIDEPMDFGDDWSDDDERYTAISQTEPIHDSPPVIYPVINHSPVRQRHPEGMNEPTPRAAVVRDPNSRFVPRTQLVPPRPSEPIIPPARGLATWVKLLLFLAIAAVFYLIYLNMDQAAKTPESLKADMPDV